LLYILGSVTVLVFLFLTCSQSMSTILKLISFGHLPQVFKLKNLMSHILNDIQPDVE